MLENRIKSSNSSLFQRRSVKETLWGYTDPLLNETIGIFTPVSKHRRYSLIYYENVELKKQFHDLHENYSPQYNGTYDGYYTVYNGKDDISKVGIIDMWRGKR